MKKIVFGIFLLMFRPAAVCGQIVFPSPERVENGEGSLTLKGNVAVYARDTSDFYWNLFRDEVIRGVSVRMTKKRAKAVVCWETDTALPAEGYRINIGPRQMEIAARDRDGFTHAVQTLRQWMTVSAEGYVFACGRISDAPRARWRGFLLDSGRQYHRVAIIKKYTELRG